MRRIILNSLAAGCLFTWGRPAHAAPPIITAGLLTSYGFYAGATGISWITCGSLPGSEGCFGSGELSGFTHVCAMIDDDARQINQTTVVQNVYVVDERPGASELVIDKFKKTDIVSQNYDTTSFVLDKAGRVPMQIGKKPCYIAADKDFLFVATGDSLQAAEVSKTTFTYTPTGSFSNNPTVASITADERGWVSVNYAGGGFYLYSPNGAGNEDGGGNQLLVNATTGTQPLKP